MNAYVLGVEYNLALRCKESTFTLKQSLYSTTQSWVLLRFYKFQLHNFTTSVFFTEVPKKNGENANTKTRRHKGGHFLSLFR